MSEAHDVEHGPNVQAYLVVFGALSVFTGLSFAFYEMFPRNVSFALILLVAVVKATLVGLYFMHLKLDWPKLYFMIIPAFILATMMMIVLMPDIVVGWH